MQFALLIQILPIFIAAVSGSVRVGTSTCWAFITTDSLSPFEDGWVTSSSPSSAAGESKVSYSTAATSSWFDNVVLSITGRPTSRVTVFDFDRTDANAESAFAGSIGSSSCPFQWQPTLPSATLMPSARFAVLPPEDASLAALFPSGNMSKRICSVNVSFTYTPLGTSTAQHVTFTLEETLLKALYASLTSSGGSPLMLSNSIDVSMTGVQWPIQFFIPFGCRTRVVLIGNQVGDLNPWYMWVPVVTYSAVVIPVALYSAYLTHGVQTSSRSRAGMIFAIFLGFTGSCIGVAIELMQWSVVTGRLFPFPDPITFFICFMCGYAILFVPLLWNHACRALISSVVFKLLVWGLMLALTVAYWIAGFVILGSISLGFLLVTSSTMIFLYTYFCSRLPLDVRPSNARWMWFPLFTPAAPLFLMYFDVIVSCGGKEQHWQHGGAVMYAAGGGRNVDLVLLDAVRLYSIMTNMAFCLLATLPTIGLLAAATSFHWPMIILFTVLVVLTILHVSTAVQQYAKERRRWKLEGLGASRLLWPAVDAVLAKRSTSTTGVRLSPSPGKSHHVVPRPGSYTSSGAQPAPEFSSTMSPQLQRWQQQQQQQQQQTYAEPPVFATTRAQQLQQAAAAPAGWANAMPVPASQIRSGSLNSEVIGAFAGGSRAPTPREYVTHPQQASAAMQQQLAFRGAGVGAGLVRHQQQQQPTNTVQSSRQPSPVPFVYD